MQTDLDPQWTTPPASGRIINPTGAVTVRDRSFNRLIYPVLSNAITHRLRYASFWCWVIANTDGLSTAEQSKYEKILLFASKYHQCEEHDGLGERGLVGAGRAVEALPEEHPRSDAEDVTVEEFYTPSVDPIPLSSAYTQLTNTNGSGFENYYRSWLIRLFLIQDSTTLTSIGARLANAYAEAHGVSWDRFEQAVENNAAPQDLIQDFAGNGCICSLSDAEREICHRVWLGLINRESTYDDLGLSTAPQEHLKVTTVEPFLARRNAGDGSPPQIGAEFLQRDDTDSDPETSLERYVEYGLDVHMRASQLLFLHSAHVAPLDTRVADSSDHPLTEIQTLWRFHIQSEQFAWTVESLLGMFLDTLRAFEPCRVDEVLTQMTADPAFTQAVEDALGGIETVWVDGSANTFDEAQLGILYGTNTTSETTVESTDETQDLPSSWSDLVTAVTDRAETDDPFDRNALSEWQLQRKIATVRSDTSRSPVERTASACGYAAVLLARFQSRYSEYYTRDALSGYRQWFAETVQYSQVPPNIQMLWHPDEYFSIDQSAPISAGMRILIQECMLRPYLDRLYDRMESGKIPQHFTVDGTRNLRFERSYPSADRSFYPNPALSRLKWQRNWDTLFELDFVSSHRPRDFHVTTTGEQLLSHVLGGAMP